MNTSILNRPVGQLVAEKPTRSRVFERWGIDYCCSGKKALHEACAAKNLDPAAVIRDIEESDAGRPGGFDRAFGLVLGDRGVEVAERGAPKAERRDLQLCASNAAPLVLRMGHPFPSPPSYAGTDRRPCASRDRI